MRKSHFVIIHVIGQINIQNPLTMALGRIGAIQELVNWNLPYIRSIFLNLFLRETLFIILNKTLIFPYTFF